MKAALLAPGRAWSRPTWRERLRRWWAGEDATWLALGQRTHTLDWWAGA